MEPGAYIDLFELASGGMAHVTLAVRRSTSFERLYAIKRLRPHLAADRDVYEMFLSEAKIAGLIRHPNVVSVLDYGVDASGPFLVMDWIDGVSLSEYVRRAVSEGPIPVALACEVVAAAARGLHASHELRNHAGEPLELVHRDVSPQNILVGFDGLVRVTDFGIAKALGHGTKTESGLLKGKIGYMSPEQLHMTPLDRRADLFALGVVLFEVLAGLRLYSSADRERPPAKRILFEPPPEIGEVRRDVPPMLEDLLLSLLAKDRQDRPESALEVAEQLEEIARDAPDGGTRLDEHLGALFATERAAMGARIASALDEATFTGRPSVPARPLTPPPRWRAPLLGLGLVLSGAVAAIAVTRLIREPEATPTVQPRASSATKPLAASSAPASPAPDTDPVAGPPPEPASPEAAEPEVAPDPTPRTRRRRGRGRSAASRPAVPRPGTDGWN